MQTINYYRDYPVMFFGEGGNFVYTGHFFSRTGVGGMVVRTFFLVQVYSKI